MILHKTLLLFENGPSSVNMHFTSWCKTRIWLSHISRCLAPSAQFTSRHFAKTIKPLTLVRSVGLSTGSDRVPFRQATINYVGRNYLNCLSFINQNRIPHEGLHQAQPNYAEVFESAFTYQLVSHGLSAFYPECSTAWFGSSWRAAGYCCWPRGRLCSTKYGHVTWSVSIVFVYQPLFHITNRSGLRYCRPDRVMNVTIYSLDRGLPR